MPEATSPFGTQALVVVPLLIPIAAAMACLLVRNDPNQQHALSLISAAVGFMAACALLGACGDGRILTLAVGGWAPPFGIVLVGDGLSSIMLVACSGISLLVLIYAGGQLPRLERTRFFYPLTHFLILGVNGSLLTGDLFNLYVWFEVMLLSSFVLLALGRKADQLEGAIKYVTLNLVASLIFLSALGLLYGKTGTLNMADLAQKLNGEPDSFLANSSAVLLLTAFGIKAALFPFFFWLPASYHTPAVTISALFAGLLTKVGIYAIFRVFTLIFDIRTGHLQEILAVIAGFTMVVGVLGAAAHFEMKRILSFHIISQIGYMIMGLTFLTPLALAGSLFFVVHNMVAKTNLFLIAGMVERACGTTDLSRTGSLYRRAPGWSFLFLVSAIGLAGLPPLSGFWAKFSLAKAGFAVDAIPLVGISLAVGLMTLFSMTKIWAEAFWKEAPRADAPEAPWAPIPGSMAFPVMVLVTGVIALGLFPEPFFNLMEIAGTQMLDREVYIEAVLGSQETSP